MKSALRNIFYDLYGIFLGVFYWYDPGIERNDLVENSKDAEWPAYNWLKSRT